MQREVAEKEIKHMKKRAALHRLPAVPLITCDPYFSVWSGSDRLYESDTMHWTGKRKRITGTAEIDGTEYRFMGTGKAVPMEQTKLEVTAFFTRYCFEMAGVELTVTFWTPLLLDDLDVLSRPCSYLDINICSTDGEKHQVEVRWEFAGELCCNQGQTEKIGGGSYELEETQTAWLGLREQRPLGHSGDSISIDWGYLYLAVEEKADRAVSYCHERRCLCADFRFVTEKIHAHVHRWWRPMTISLPSVILEGSFPVIGQETEKIFSLPSRKPSGNGARCRSGVKLLSGSWKKRQGILARHTRRSATLPTASP